VSVYTINEICYRAVHDPPFRAAIVADPEGTLATLDLTAEERRALLECNIGQLYLWGANTYMLGHLMRYKIFGVTRDKYATSIWAAARSAGRPAGGP
jgi:hypothetical protein